MEACTSAETLLAEEGGGSVAPGEPVTGGAGAGGSGRPVWSGDESFAQLVSNRRARRARVGTDAVCPVQMSSQRMKVSKADGSGSSIPGPQSTVSACASSL